MGGSGNKGCNGKYQEVDFSELNGGDSFPTIIRGVLVSYCTNIIRKGMMGWK